MAREPVITITGNIGGDPELRFTPSGLAVCNFNVAVTPARKEGDQWVDGEAMWFRCNVWRDYAEHVAESLERGMRVHLTGRFRVTSYETRDGEKRTQMEIDVDEIGPSLRFATAKVQRTQRSSNTGSSGGGGGGGSDPWASSAQADEPPF